MPAKKSTTAASPQAAKKDFDEKRKQFLIECLPSPTGYVPEFEREKQNTYISDVLLTVILGGLYLLAFSTRLFAVVRYESVIHEFDPYFNFRTTQRLTTYGWYDFWNWFDDTVWYPLGRAVGATVYPGLMMTAGIVYFIADFMHFTIEIRNVCVFLAPVFAGNTALVTYFFTKEIRGKGAGLVAAALISVIPGYVSRSVAGSYDNEAVAIFAIIFVFYTFVKSVNTGSLLWAFVACLAWFYMVNAWGGYIFLINLIPLYVFVMVLTGRYTHRLYIAYSVFWVLGTILAMQVQFVNFKALLAGEHFISAITFAGLQFYALMSKIQDVLEKGDEKNGRALFLEVVKYVAAAIVVFLVFGYFLGLVQPFTGRFYVLLDPTYAGSHIPIIASVSEHQPTGWASMFFDLNICLLLAPTGLYFCFRDMSDASLFIILYGMTAGYFAGIMVRLVLVFAPAACILAAIALSETLRTYTDLFVGSTSALLGLSDTEEIAAIEKPTPTPPSSTSKKAKAAAESADTGAPNHAFNTVFSVAVISSVFFVFWVFMNHSLWVTSEAYSSPSIVLQTRGHDGSRHIIDDFREAYRWLSQNTPDNSKIMSWWDYGYQMAAMANRTTLVDNNTWNNTHIATVGRAMASTEEEAYKIMRKLDVDYVLVIFGGRLGYSSDDINKFLWMVRISAGVYPEHVREKDFYDAGGQYRVDAGASKTMLNSLMYKMCYYRFGELMTGYRQTGYDRVRHAEIGKKNYKLTRVEEAFTSENWIVRIFKVKPEPNRSGGP